VDKDHPRLSIRTQCELLGVSRSSLDYRPVAVSADDLRLMRLMDEIYLVDPCVGTRRLVTLLERDHGQHVNRKRLQRLRREMGLETIWCRPRTSVADEGHRKFPYLLGDLEVTRLDQVWCADITYVPMPRGHAYLCAVMDWHSRKVLGWAVSYTVGNEALPAGTGRRRGAQRGLPAGLLQHRPGQPVYPRGMDRENYRLGNRGKHGRQGAVDGQRVHRAALAQREIRGNLPARARHRSGAGRGPAGVV